MTTSLFPQTNSISNVELPVMAITNIQSGIDSGNAGLIFSCIFYAGKHKATEVNEGLLNTLKNSNSNDLCKMLA